VFLAVACSWQAPVLLAAALRGAVAVPPPKDFNGQAEGPLRVANIKSQIKRNKQNEKAHMRNKAAKSALKTHVRKFREAAESGNVEEATEALRVASRQLDKAVGKGIIHKNQAANRKSAIARKLNELQNA
jgi:small subunit ribosomal protein S20